jgi:hypothetical protein
MQLVTCARQLLFEFACCMLTRNAQGCALHGNHIMSTKLHHCCIITFVHLYWIVLTGAADTSQFDPYPDSVEPPPLPQYRGGEDPFQAF